MTVKLNFSDDAYTCTLPKDSGSCDNKIFRYYYNAIEVSQEEVMSCCLSRPFFLISSSRSYHHYFQRRCKLFVYGGCKGNGNNFVSEVQCLQKCGDEADLALLPQVEITTEIGKKKRGTRKTRFSPGLRLELDCTQTNEIRTIRTSSQLLRTMPVILQLHVDLKTEFLCEIFPPPPLL